MTRELRDRLYLAAIKLPPSPERDVIIDGLVLDARQAAQPKSELHRQAVRYYRQILECVEGGQFPRAYADKTADWLSAAMAEKPPPSLTQAETEAMWASIQEPKAA